MEKGLRLTMYGHADLWLLLCPDLAVGPEKLNPMVACCLSDGGHKGLRCLFVAKWVVLNSFGFGGLGWLGRTEMNCFSK